MKAHFPFIFFQLDDFPHGGYARCEYRYYTTDLCHDILSHQNLDSNIHRHEQDFACVLRHDDDDDHGLFAHLLR